MLLMLYTDQDSLRGITLRYTLLGTRMSMYTLLKKWIYLKELKQTLKN